MVIVVELEEYRFGFDGIDTQRLSEEFKNFWVDLWCALEWEESVKPCTVRRMLQTTRVSTLSCGFEMSWRVVAELVGSSLNAELFCIADFDSEKCGFAARYDGPKWFYASVSQRMNAKYYKLSTIKIWFDIICFAGVVSTLICKVANNHRLWMSRSDALALPK